LAGGRASAPARIGTGPSTRWAALHRDSPRLDLQSAQAGSVPQRGQNRRELFRRSALAGAAAIAVLLALAPKAEARVTKIIIDTKVSPAFGGASFGTAGRYETLAGRVFGELNPYDRHDAIINDIELAPRNANGRVEYMATFFLVKPIDMSKS